MSEREQRDAVDPEPGRRLTPEERRRRLFPEEIAFIREWLAYGHLLTLTQCRGLLAERDALATRVERLTLSLHRCLDAMERKPGDGVTLADVPTIRSLIAQSDAEAALKLALYCPHCGERHIDQGEWATEPHHKHLCERCGHVWDEGRFTFGVADEVVRDA